MHSVITHVGQVKYKTTSPFWLMLASQAGRSIIFYMMYVLQTNLPLLKIIIMIAGTYTSPKSYCDDAPNVLDPLVVLVLLLTHQFLMNDIY